MSPMSSPTPESPLRKIFRHTCWGIGGTLLLLSAQSLLKVLFGDTTATLERIRSGMPSILPLVTGVAILYGLPLLYDRLVSLLKLTKEYPDEPWRWREDWNRGTIRSRGHVMAIAPWIAGVYIMVLSSGPMAIHGSSLFQQGLVTVASALFGPCLGVLVLGYATLSLARWQKYGVSTIELTTNPGVVGGWLRVDLHSKLFLGQSDHLLASLRCSQFNSKRSIQRDGVNKMSKDLVWRQSREISAEGVAAQDKAHSVIPLEFYIPHHLDNSGPLCVWELDVQARVDGPNYQATFKVPVFKTRDSTLAPPRMSLSSLGIPFLTGRRKRRKRQGNTSSKTPALR